MIHTISLSNFRSFETLTVTFSKNPEELVIDPSKIWDKIFLSGANRVGKTTILEALNFAFTGRDSAGHALPTHLIGDYSDKARVVIESTRGTITRTLTHKKNTTARWKCSDDHGPFLLDKTTDFESSAFGNNCSNDAFMSATIPGFFMTLPVARRKVILTKILPKIDRYDHVAAKAEVDVSFVRKHCKLEKESLHQNEFTRKRLTLQKEYERNQGQANYLTTVLEAPQNMPEKPEAFDLIDEARENHEIYKKYMHQLELYNDSHTRAESAVAENNERMRRKKKIEEDMEKTFELKPYINIKEIQDKIDELMKTMKPTPKKPSLLLLPDSDSCPTCGQTVRQNYRESVRSMYDKELEGYNKRCEEARDHNIPIEDEIIKLGEELKVAQAKNSEAKAHNYSQEAIRKQLQDQLANIAPMKIPPIRDKPEEPKVKYFRSDEIRKMQRDIDAYHTQVGIYQKAQANIAHAEQTIKEIGEQNSELREKIEMYSKVEWAIRNLIADEVQMNEKYLQMEGYNIDTSEDRFHVTTKRGIPYGCMSTGERMLFDLKLCFKFRALLPNPPMYIFLDNADLADWVMRMWNNTRMERGQLFVTGVNEGPLRITGYLKGDKHE